MCGGDSGGKRPVIFLKLAKSTLRAVLHRCRENGRKAVDVGTLDVIIFKCVYSLGVRTNLEFKGGGGHFYVTTN